MGKYKDSNSYCSEIKIWDFASELQKKDGLCELSASLILDDAPHEYVKTIVDKDMLIICYHLSSEVEVTCIDMRSVERQPNKSNSIAIT